MKLNRYIKIASFCAFTAIGLVSCDNDSVLGPSAFDLTEKPRTELDQWIYDSFTAPYNISATYKWNQAQGYYDKTLFPPKEENVQPALGMVKKIWIDSYTQAGGEDFVKAVAPRQLHLVGSYNVNNDGTITLGEAGGGARITLFNTDYVKHDNLASIRQFVHTVQHEYVHILNQNKDYNRIAWSSISPGGDYSSSWYLYDNEESNEMGFVTSYARSNFDEDFAETASFILMHTKVEWEEFLTGLKSAEAKSTILRKVDLVEKYYKDQLNLDFWQLRDFAEENTNQVLLGNF